MKSDLGYKLIDSDNHYYEVLDCFTRHLETEFQDRTIRWIVDTNDGAQGGHWMVGDRRYSFTKAGCVEIVSQPGGRADFFAGKKEIGFTTDEADLIRPLDFDEFLRADARLPVMDAQGVEAALLLPTFGVMWEHDFRQDTSAFYANVRSFNRWVQEDWGFGDNKRTFGAAIMSLRDLDSAITELERLGAAGAKVICLKVGPVYGRSPADTYFDPFWRRVEEMGMLTAFHITNAGYTELVSSAWGEDPNPYNSDMTAFQHYTCYINRPISDTLAALILGNLFGRFPGLKVLTLELGSSWVHDLLADMDRNAIHAAAGRWPGGHLTDKPSDVFKNHIYVAPFHEDNILQLAEDIPTSHILFGSDWPHGEGIAEPGTFTDYLTGLQPEDIRLIMRDNAASLLGVTA
jgi:predicted TIM-barrel fold metal-dependent hydrolase